MPVRAASQSYRQDPNSPINVKALAEHMQFHWEDRQELRMVELSFSEIMRSILATPATQKLEFIGDFNRITKPIKQSFSPIVYGPLGDLTYLSTIKGCAKNHIIGVKALRRVVDHMAAFNYVPTQDVIKAVIFECVDGKWPNTALAFMDYVISKKIVVTTSAVVDAVGLMRRTKSYFPKGVDLAKRAIESGCQQDIWPALEPLIVKYLKHNMIAEAAQLTEESCAIAAKRKPTEEGKSHALKPEEIVRKTKLQFLTVLLEAKLQANALELFTKWFANDKSMEVVHVALSIYERFNDSDAASKYLEQVQKQKDFAIDRQTLVSILKIAKNSEDKGVALADRFLPQLFSPAIYSPFALNLILMIYGTKNLKRVADVCAQVARTQARVNYFTYLTLSKILRTIPDSEDRDAIIKSFKAISFPEAPPEKANT